MDPNTDADRFAELLAGIGETYNQKVSGLRTTIYFGALREFEFDIVNAAMMRHVQTSKFFPTPADIREIIDGNDSDREGVAWNAFTDAIKRIGPYQSVIVEDPVIASAICITFGSWIGACEARSAVHESQWHARRKDFGASVRTARRDPRTRNAGPRLLTGYCDAENRSNRTTWDEGKKISHQLYGVITVDGKVYSKRLEVNAETLLPAASLKSVMMLPAGPEMPLLGGDVVASKDVPIDPTYLELTPAQAREKFEREFSSMMERKGLKARTLTDEEHAARVAELKAQANAGESSQVHAREPEDTEPVSAPSTSETGDPDRSATQSNQGSDVGDGVSVRVSNRKKVEVRSGVAGTHARGRNRGRGVR